MPGDKPNSEHIGDGVYLSDDGFQLWLAVNHHSNNVVALDPQVFEALVHRGLERMRTIYPNYTIKF